MRRIFLSAGLATAVICSAQAQETVSQSSTQEAIEKQEEALETLKEAVQQQEQALEELKQAAESEAQAMSTDVTDPEVESTTEAEVDVYEQPTEVEQTSAETSMETKEAATETAYEAEEAGQEVEEATTETELAIESGVEEVDETAAETEQAIDNSAEEVSDEVEETADETEQAIESGAEEVKEEGQALKNKTEEETTNEAQNMQATVQSSQDTTQSSQDEFNSQDLKKITEAELPQEVKDSFNESEYNEATIEQAYEVSGATVSQILESRANASQYPGTEVPEKLYQLQVKEEDGAAIIYIGDDGEIIASESM